MDVLIPEIEGDYAPLYAEYREELAAAIASVEPWWEQLRASVKRRVLRARWPAGIASHPRVLGVYRRYHQRCVELADLSRHGPAPRFDDDAAWGSEVELSPALLVAPKPSSLLVDRLHVEAPELFEKMSYLLMLPVVEVMDPAPNITQLEPLGFEQRPPESFDFGGPHMAALGLRRLLGAGIDLRARAYENLSPSEASVLHRQAFAAYERDLEAALRVAERWWAERVVEELRRGLSREDASARVWSEHRLGPVTHPRVLGVVCAYWALCHEINDMIQTSKEQLAPELMLLAWLRDGRHDSWLDLLCAMPYWPVALDRAGRWS